MNREDWSPPSCHRFCFCLQALFSEQLHLQVLFATDVVSFSWFGRNNQLLWRTVCSFQETLVTCNYPFPFSLLLCLLHFWSYFKLLDAGSFPVLSPFVMCDGGGVVEPHIKVLQPMNGLYGFSRSLLHFSPLCWFLCAWDWIVTTNSAHFPSLSWQAPATYLFLGDVTFTFPWGENH